MNESFAPLLAGGAFLARFPAPPLAPSAPARPRLLGIDECGELGAEVAHQLGDGKIKVGLRQSTRHALQLVASKRI
jgi:hypothetical protein